MIEILLATYNGEKYLRQQIESLLSQKTDEPFRIVIRDDGSKDQTVSLIESMKKLYPDKILFVKDNKSCGGAASNFFCLLAHASADYIMFCDQDDYWYPNKINAILNTMRQAERENRIGMPLLVYSDYRVVNDELKPLNENKKNNMVFKHKSDFNHLLVQNYVTGCTMMINKPLAQLLKPSYRSEILMHDWWIALLASATGKIIFFNQVLMDYRQHSGQSVGAVDVRSFKYRIKKFMNPNTKNMDKKCVIQAKAFYEEYANILNPQIKSSLEKYISLSQHNKIIRMYTILKMRYLKSDSIRVLGQLLYI